MLTGSLFKGSLILKEIQSYPESIILDWNKLNLQIKWVTQIETYNTQIEKKEADFIDWLIVQEQREFSKNTELLSGNWISLFKQFGWFHCI